MNSSNTDHVAKLIDRQALDDLFRALRSRGYTLVGPKVCDQAIVYDEIETPDDLPVGWTDEQEAGSYRIKKRGDDALFGYAPLPIQTASGAEPILSVGAHQKNTVALALNGQVFISQHIGDLVTQQALEAFDRATVDLPALYDANSRIVACDLHPDYLSTKQAGGMDCEILRVQHHHAHIAACMAEHNPEGSVLGVSWDGAGYINTAGIGVVKHELDIAPKSVRPGDSIIVNGDIGRHGMAIMAQREGLEFETTIESDSSPVAASVQELLDAGVEVHCMRDLTRGGLASALNEIASAARMQIELDERAIPVRDDVQGACEILGFDPLYVACEGRFVSFILAQDAEQAQTVLSANEGAEQAQIIGSVTGTAKPMVTLITQIGSTRIVDMLSGEQLPRIC